jgi:hypothetical protein
MGIFPSPTGLIGGDGNVIGSVEPQQNRERENISERK